VHVGMGTFFQNPLGARPDAEIWRQGLEIAGSAERLGFDSVWSAEHHFSDYHLCPNVAQFLTWVAARTTRVRLGSMVMVLPWHDPVRLAEEICVLDHMSGGRVLLGVGRGLGRVEFDGFRVEMGESRRRFTEYFEAILAGLETGVMAYEGELYRQPRIELRPAPLATFRGRVYASAISPETSRILAELGVGMMIIAQKPWETVEADVATYRALYREINGEESPKPLLVSWIAVHESQAAAEEMFERWIVGYAHTTLVHYEFANAGLAEIPGYEYYGKLAQRIAKHGPDAFAHFLAGLQVWGTPASVTEQLRENVRRIDGAGVVGIFNYAGMPDDVARANIACFADRVLPALRGVDTGSAEGSPLTVGALPGPGATNGGAAPGDR
jgi:alkanesulfonate monooxygenase SsuD/methylene tetrahydromethanopterin reductase-like flavin-dependent oxidoreductase (luciferase family)